ncbi:glycosyltransferase family 4 protein [Novosphingobium bradum]|uniref:Glycosyltransferase family 4 protein n=1 Tax=Novosphingobium bradum TaxID=1737444 RepID=A0ABV7IUB8_9SPHN
MKILFVHQNMPGQFKHLAPALARAGHEVTFLTQRGDVDLPGVRRATYAKPRAAHASTHHYVRLFENSVLAGQQVVRACQQLQRHGWMPDVIVAHPGWGEALFVKDVWPHVPLLNYCEFYYGGPGSDIGFLPEEPADLDAICRVRARNASHLLSLEACDAGLSPTRWQHSRHPAPFQPRIRTIFDGIDSGIVRPNPRASFTLPGGRVLTAADEVVTYVARNLEPYRGYPSFIRALPGLLAQRPEAQVVIVGGDEVSYGRGPPEAPNWREHMAREVSLDPARVHFTGKLPYARYLALLQVSSLHIYLTVPFVLSWSCLEAMSAGCLVLASDTAPVLEAVEDGVNGLLCDFHSPVDIASKATAALAARADLGALRKAARQTVLDRYDLSRCLPAQMRLVEDVAAMRG